MCRLIEWIKRQNYILYRENTVQIQRHKLVKWKDVEWYTMHIVTRRERAGGATLTWQDRL